MNVESLFGTGVTGLFTNDPDKNYWLNLLGYNISASATGVTLANLPTQPELRQVGAIMHSKPVLLTQKGKLHTLLAVSTHQIVMTIYCLVVHKGYYMLWMRKRGLRNLLLRRMK